MKKQNKYNIHPDFLKYRMLKLPLNRVVAPIVSKVFTMILNRIKVPEGLREERYRIKGYNDEHINVSVISPTNTSEPLPALVYFHGGAFIMQASPYLKRLMFDYALKTPCKVIFVDYRLLPSSPYPVGLEDCYSSYLWTRDNHEDLGIKSNKIAVGGDSAGGTMAAGVCLMARDRNIPLPCFQMLIYPVIDKNQNSDSVKTYIDTPLWNSIQNAKMWKIYLKEEDKEYTYASPISADNLKNLSAAYIEVCEFDPLHDEGIAYGNALIKSGIAVEIYETKRTVHGFEIAVKNDIVSESKSRRINILQKVFYCT